MAWTDDRVEMLKSLWGDGLSASQIAGELGDVTRNGVIGKLHRLGLTGNKKPGGSSSPRRSRKSRAKVGGGASKSLPVEELPEIDVIDLEIPETQRRHSVLELDAHTCSWPVGDPLDPEFFFCGAAAIEGLPYCAAHQRRARVPIKRPVKPYRSYHHGGYR